MKFEVGMHVRIKLPSHSHLGGYCGWIDEIDDDPNDDKPILVYVNDCGEFFDESELEIV